MLILSYTVFRSSCRITDSGKDTYTYKEVIYKQVNATLKMNKPTAV